MASEIHRLIAETERWRGQHASAGRQIEAAACAIRIKALRDALATFCASPNSTPGA